MMDGWQSCTKFNVSLSLSLVPVVIDRAEQQQQQRGTQRREREKERQGVSFCSGSKSDRNLTLHLLSLFPLIIEAIMKLYVFEVKSQFSLSVEGRKKRVMTLVMIMR